MYECTVGHYKIDWLSRVLYFNVITESQNLLTIYLMVARDCYVFLFQVRKTINHTHIWARLSPLANRFIFHSRPIELLKFDAFSAVIVLTIFQGFRVSLTLSGFEI